MGGLLRELCHHFDYERLGLRDSYHTQGFFRRESSLARQLLPREGPLAAATPAEVAGQLCLPGVDPGG